jgi:hypothetical protein
MRLGMPRGAVGVAAIVIATGFAAIGAGSASALEVIYDNQNTVPTVGAVTEDTYSEAFVATGSASIGGLVEFAGAERKLTSLTAELDSFRCQQGSYTENTCISRPGKKFAYTMTVKIYAVTEALERGALLGEQNATAKLPYRPSTNASCPETGEGKGFGSNCDVGGVLAHVKFKNFTQHIQLPNQAIIEVSTPTPDDDVNVGLEGAYKEYNVERGGFVGVPGSGAPEIGSEPLPNEAFLNGVASSAFEGFPSGFEGYQPVFKVIAKPGPGHRMPR